MLSARGTISNRVSGVFRWVGVGLAACLLPVGPAAAQRESAERELELAKKRVHALRHVAEQLQELGRREMAQELRREAAELAARLERHLAERERARAERGETEREVARRQLTVMRYAVEALVEADKHDAADLIERALHARELALEGRRDEEAARIRETAPKRGQQAELLGLAAELLQDAGRTERATVVGRLARELAGKRGRRPAEHSAREGHEQAEHLEAAMQRIERLEGRLHELMEAVEALQAELHKLKRKLD